jgi:hypothetical protein
MNPSELASFAARDPIIEEILPYDEAVSRVKKTRRQISLMVGTWAPYTVQAGVKPGYQFGTNTPGSLLQVTKKQALKFLDDAFPKHWRPKLSIRVGVSKRCMFIGSSPR